MDRDQRFRKYQWIVVEVNRPRQDTRPESFTPNLDSISIESEVLSSGHNWAARKEFVSQMIGPNMCELRQLGSVPGGPSLGLIKPKNIQRVSITPEDNPEWSSEEFAKLRQYSLFGETPKNELEKIPYKFTYHFHCEDDHCGGHSMMCSDWEMAALYRRTRREYGENWQQPFLDMYQTRMINDFDTYFYVGTVSGHWNTWIIVGVWRASKTDQLQLL
jgi:hypothetical protein